MRISLVLVGMMHRTRETIEVSHYVLAPTHTAYNQIDSALVSVSIFYATSSKLHTCI
jgi:hypothetical protein